MSLSRSLLPSPSRSPNLSLRPHRILLRNLSPHQRLLLLRIRHLLRRLSLHQRQLQLRRQLRPRRRHLFPIRRMIIAVEAMITITMNLREARRLPHRLPRMETLRRAQRQLPRGTDRRVHQPRPGFPVTEARQAQARQARVQALHRVRVPHRVRVRAQARLGGGLKKSASSLYFFSIAY